MSARLSLVAAVAAINLVGVTLFYAVSHGVDANKDPGKHSAFTREQLRTTWAGAKRFPLVVPARMPAGAESDPEIGFSLDNVVTDPAHHLSRRVWVSYYESDVLGGRGTSFRIFQRDRQVPSQKPCGPVAKQHSSSVTSPMPLSPSARPRFPVGLPPVSTGRACPSPATTNEWTGSRATCPSTAEGLWQAGRSAVQRCSVAPVERLRQRLLAGLETAAAWAAVAAAGGLVAEQPPRDVVIRAVLIGCGAAVGGILGHELRSHPRRAPGRAARRRSRGQRLDA